MATSDDRHYGSKTNGSVNDFMKKEQMKIY